MKAYNNMSHKMNSDQIISSQMNESKPTNIPFRGVYEGSITALSKNPNSVEIWWIDKKGAVKGAYWEEGGQWHQYVLAPENSAYNDASITAVARKSNVVDVWWIGKNGSVQGAFWQQGGQWQRYELAAPDSASPFAKIKAVSRNPSTVDVLWNGLYFSLEGASWREGGQWQRYQVVKGDVQGQFTVVSRDSGNLNVFWITAEGMRIDGAAWREGIGWKPFWFPTLDYREEPSVYGNIKAISRIPNSIELWWITKYGAVLGAAWYAELGPEGNWKVYVLSPKYTASRTGNITAVSRIPNSMEVWWYGKDNSIQDSFWYEGSPWHQYSLTPPYSTGLRDGELTSLSRKPNTMEVFWIADNTIQGAFWQEGIGWNRFELMR